MSSEQAKPMSETDTPGMNTQETIEFVRNFNRWRRGDESLDMPNPQRVGEALDDLCDLAEKLERERNELLRDVHQPELCNEKIMGLERERDTLREMIRGIADRIGDEGNAMWERSILEGLERLSNAQ